MRHILACAALAAALPLATAALAQAPTAKPATPATAAPTTAAPPSSSGAPTSAAPAGAAPSAAPSALEPSKTTPSASAAGANAATTAPAGLTTGMSVKDSTGALIGEVKALNNGQATIQMGPDVFSVEASKLGVQNGVAMINATQAQLKAMLPKK